MEQKVAEPSLSERMQAELSEKLEDAFEMVIASKNEHYQQNPQDIPEVGQIRGLIQSSAAMNAAISGGAGLIPGPWGMLAVIPELLVVTRNQIGLIYDIAAAHGKRDIINKELLLGVFVSAMGTTAGSLLVMHGGKVLVRRASLRVMQKLITLLGGKITQQALKSAVSKWLPGVGAVAMAAWTNYLTRQIGQKADALLRKDFEIVDSEATIELIEPVAIAPASESESNGAAFEYYKLQVLIGLARIDGEVSDEEADFINNLVESSSLEPAQVLQLTAQLGAQAKPLEGIEALAASPDNAIALLSSMTALARTDENFHITEKLYIRQIGKLLGFQASDIEEVMA